MAKAENRIVISLACPDCKERNYHTTKNRKTHPNRLELNKFCPRCRGYKVHREAK